MKLELGQRAPDFEVVDVSGAPVRLADYANDYLLLSFSRFASCPLCNLRLQLLTQRYPDFKDRGLRIIGFFESSPESILSHEIRQNAPFPLIGDPQRSVYDLYGLEASWGKFVRSFFMPSMLSHFKAMPKTERMVPRRGDGKLSTMPADFLIEPGLRVAHAHYGRNVADHIPLKLVHEFVDSRRSKSA